MNELMLIGNMESRESGEVLLVTSKVLLIHFWDFFFVFYFCGCVVVENSH